MAYQDDIALMAHLMRRAAFGAGRDELEARVAKGYEATVEELLHPETQPAVDMYTLLRYQPASLLPGGQPPMGNVNFMYHLVNTKRPLEEKMALFWHHVFATGNSKVDNYDQLLEQIGLFRQGGMGNYRDLLVTIARNPTMIFWLDNNQNHGTAVNQNWGRELLEGPAGEGAGRFTDILFRVGADAHAEQLKQLATPVLVDGRAVVLVVVQPEDHRGVSGDRDEQVAVVTHATLTEQADLLQQLIVVVHLRVAGGEHVVPEERHFLFQRALRVHQVIHEIHVPHRVLPARQQRRRLIAEQRVDIDCRLGLGVEQLLDSRFVPLGHARFELVAARAEARTAHQVSHQRDVVLVCHTPNSFSCESPSSHCHLPLTRVLAGTFVPPGAEAWRSDGARHRLDTSHRPSSCASSRRSRLLRALSGLSVAPAARTGRSLDRISRR